MMAHLLVVIRVAVQEMIQDLQHWSKSPESLRHDILKNFSIFK